MRMHKWEDALALADRPEYRGRFDDIVFLPYAQYLARLTALTGPAAFKRAGRPEESLKLLTALADCATAERRFKAAAYYYKQLGQENIRVAREIGQANSNSAQAASPGSFNPDLNHKVHMHRLQAKESDTLAAAYFAYALVHQYTEDPFAKLSVDEVFSASIFLINTLTCKSFRNRVTATHISGLDPPGISRVHVL